MMIKVVQHTLFHLPFVASDFLDTNDWSSNVFSSYVLGIDPVPTSTYVRVFVGVRYTYVGTDAVPSDTVPKWTYGTVLMYLLITRPSSTYSTVMARFTILVLPPVPYRTLNALTLDLKTPIGIWYQTYNKKSFPSIFNCSSLYTCSRQFAATIITYPIYSF